MFATISPTILTITAGSASPVNSVEVLTTPVLEHPIYYHWKSCTPCYPSKSCHSTPFSIGMSFHHSKLYFPVINASPITPNPFVSVHPAVTGNHILPGITASSISPTHVASEILTTIGCLLPPYHSKSYRLSPLYVYQSPLLPWGSVVPAFMASPTTLFHSVSDFPANSTNPITSTHFMSEFSVDTKVLSL